MPGHGLCQAGVFEDVSFARVAGLSIFSACRVLETSLHGQHQPTVALQTLDGVASVMSVGACSVMIFLSSMANWPPVKLQPPVGSLAKGPGSG